MNKIEDKSWGMLTSQEQNSLALSLSQGLSTWEVGEIMEISHYKYLEIKERSEKFFRLFIDYFNLVGRDQLFSPNSPVDSSFKEYIEACIERRMTRLDATSYVGDSSLTVYPIHSKNIIKGMERLKDSDDQSDHHLYKLIMEFDRWNNKRILPRAIQMPSAYKRRNNKRDKVYIKYISSISTQRVENMINLFSYNPTKAYKKRYYIAIMSNEIFEDGYMVISVKADDTTLDRLGKLYIYVFKEEEHANLFGFLVTRFKDKTNKAKLGQQFWPEYRESINRAINFKDINNIHFYSEELDQAYNTISIRKKLKGNDSLRHGAKRVPEKLL